MNRVQSQNRQDERDSEESAARVSTRKSVTKGKYLVLLIETSIRRFLTF